MKILYLTTLLKMTWETRKSKRTIIIILLCTILMAFAGVLAIRKAMGERSREIVEYQSAMSNYEKNLEEMNTSLTALLSNQKTIQGQYDTQKKYCEESIYMQMDGNAFYQGDIRYSITTSTNMVYLTSALTSYINGAAFRESLSKQFGNVDSTYLKEVISCVTTGNILLITVYHYDAKIAEQLLELVDKTLTQHVPTIAKTQGEFTLTVMESSVSKKADIAIVNTQNASLNSLRTYTTALADVKNAISNKQQDIEFYQTENYPEEVVALSAAEMAKKEIIFLALGVILGICVLVCRTLLQVMLGKTISNSDFFTSLNLTVLGDYGSKSEENAISEKIGQQLDLYAIHFQAEKIYLIDLSNDSFPEDYMRQYQTCLEDTGAAISCASSEENQELIERNMVKNGNILFAVKIGQTTYKKFEEYYGICKQFHLNVVGVIFTK